MGVSMIETAIADEAECRDVHDRLVYGGTPHEQNPAPRRVDAGEP
jgi:hypothetical protein